MRIIAGDFRGRPLAALGKGDPAAHLRPTSDRVRESLFSMLTHRDAIVGKRVLDVFAGTGALGFEALSRGGRETCFIENGRAGQRLISQNIEMLGVQGSTTVMRNDATRLGPWPHAPFDLVFLDPPYGKGLGQRALTALRQGGWCAPRAIVVWEESAAMDAPEGYEFLDARRFGDTHVTLLRVGLPED